MSTVIIIMGVSGSGKSTIAKLLSSKIKIPYYDADDFHPAGNISKMKQGSSLTDEDRDPWLYALSRNIEKWQQSGGAILACSALKEAYREVLNDKNIRWLYLRGTFKTIYSRMETRNHFMPPQLLKSQFAILEEPPYGFYADISNSPQEIVEQCISYLSTYE